MNKIEFLSKLEQCLQNFPFEERLEALNYYKGYIEDAGPDMEEQVIQDLESPERIAELLKQQNEDVFHSDSNAESNSEGIYTEEGYRSNHQEKEQKELIHVSETYNEEIQSIDIKVYMGTVKVISGTEFQIVANNVDNNQFYSVVDHGVWRIQDVDGTVLKAFSSKLNNLFQGKVRDCYPDVTIYVPTGFIAEYLQLYVGAGTVRLEDITAKKVRFSVNAGKLYGDRILVKEQTNITINTGEAKLNNISAADVSLKCNVGNMEYNGSMIGDSKVNCNVGCIQLGLQAQANEYEYDISCTLGEVLINGTGHKQFQEEMKQQSIGYHSLKLHCDIGSIIVKTGGKENERS